MSAQPCMRCVQAPGVIRTNGFLLCEGCAELAKAAIAEEVIAAAAPRARYGERLAQALAIAEQHGVVTSALLSARASISKSMASGYLHTLAKQGWLVFEGKGRFRLASLDGHFQPGLAEPNEALKSEARKRWALQFDQVWGTANDIMGMFAADQQMQVVALNQAFERMFGHGLAEAQAMSLEHRLQLSENVETADEVIARLQIDDYVQCALRLRDSTRRLITLEVHYYVVQRDPEIIVFVHASVEDKP